MSAQLSQQDLRSLSPYYIRPQQRRWLIEIFWLLTLCLLILMLFQGSAMQSTLGAVIIATAALCAPYMWCRGIVVGLPLFPVFTFSFLWSYSLPLVFGNPGLEIYSPEEQLIGAIKVALFLVTATLVWFPFAISVPFPPKRFLALPRKMSDKFFLLILSLAVMYYFALNSSMLFWIPNSLISPLRTFILGLTTLAVFILSYNLGKGTLSRRSKYLFLTLFVVFLFSSALGLFLIVASTPFSTAVIGYFVGSKKFPWRIILFMFFVLALLHAGKGEMRGKYWNQKSNFWESPASKNVYPWQYPQRYAEWFGYSFEKIKANYLKDPVVPPDRQEKEYSILDRVCVIHMFLRALAKAGTEETPFLYGKTYWIIPQMLIPRIINPSRLTTHEGTYLLNIHFGLQDRQATKSTTIGWGYLSEAYANFGYLGCIGLAIFLGSFFGLVARWCLFTPILSLRSIFAIMVMSLTPQRELAAGLFLTILSQATIVFVTISFIFMRYHYNAPLGEQDTNTKMPLLY